MPMLDIIVTHYKEPWEVGKPLFDILALQRGIDFDQIKVILVNDGQENHLDDALFAGYPYKVEQLDIPHGGVSAARNAGMDHATAEWINFCDFDDTYANVYAIKDILNILPAPDYDFLWAQLLTEDFTGQNTVLKITPEKAVFVFIHGKYYRRQWLLDSGIRFDETMPFQEDSLFNAYVIALLDYHRIGKINTYAPVYIWGRRLGSVSNSGREDEAVYGHFIRNLKVCEFYLKHLPEERLQDMVVRTTYDTYYMCNSTRCSTGMRVRIIREYQDFLAKFGQYYHRPDDATLLQMEEISRGELMDRLVPGDYNTVTKWKDTLLKGEDY